MLGVSASTATEDVRVELAQAGQIKEAGVLHEMNRVEVEAQIHEAIANLVDEPGVLVGLRAGGRIVEVGLDLHFHSLVYPSEAAAVHLPVPDLQRPPKERELLRVIVKVVIWLQLMIKNIYQFAYWRHVLIDVDDRHLVVIPELDISLEKCLVPFLIVSALFLLLRSYLRNLV